MRRRIGLAAAIIVLVGACGPTAVPDPSAALGLLRDWEMSAQLAREGTVVTATYERWPLPSAPRVFACIEKPDDVFAGPPTHILVIEADPACREFTSRLDGRRLRLSLDEAGLPPTFATRDTWHVAFAVVLDQATWSAETILPVHVGPMRPSPS
jgi:hypothetical protein